MWDSDIKFMLQLKYKVMHLEKRTAMESEKRSVLLLGGKKNPSYQLNQLFSTMVAGLSLV